MDIDGLILNAERELSAKYTYIKYYAEGANSVVLRLKRGAQEFVTKIDVPDGEISSQTARHARRWHYTTDRETLHVFNEVPSPQEHNLTRLYDFVNADGNIYPIYDFVEGQSLESRISNSGLTVPQARSLIPQLVDAVSHLNENELFHRDIKPGNVIVSNNLSKLWLTDFGYLITKEDAKKEVATIGGSDKVTDPLLFATFTANPTQYSDQSELYALGKTVLFMLTGCHWITYHPYENGIVKVNGRQISIEGSLTENHAKYIGQALDRIPSRLRKSRAVIERLTTLDTEKRYRNFSDGCSDLIGSIAVPGYEKAINNPKLLTVALSFSILVGGYFHNSHSTSQREEYNLIQQYNRHIAGLRPYLRTIANTSASEIISGVSDAESGMTPAKAAFLLHAGNLFQPQLQYFTQAAPFLAKRGISVDDLAYLFTSAERDERLRSELSSQVMRIGETNVSLLHIAAIGWMAKCMPSSADTNSSGTYKPPISTYQMVQRIVGR